MLRRVQIHLVIVLLCAALPAAAFAWKGNSQGIIENRGQLHEQVRYYAHCDGGVSLYFTDTALVLDLVEEQHAVWMFFDGASPPARIEAHDPSDARLHFFLGDDPGQWRTDVRLFGELVYRDLWPGIDLRFGPEAGGLRYEIAARPGADPDRAGFRFAGDDDRIVASDGGARLEAGSRVLLDVPVASDGSVRVLHWQEDRSGNDRWGDAGPGTDSPSTVLYSTLIGGGHWDRAHGLTLDTSGNPMITGYSFSADFPTTQGAYDRTWNGGYDVYVAKFDPTGSALIWSTYVGGDLEDRGFAIDLDDAGNPVVACLSKSSNWPTTEGAFDRALGGTQDAAVFKLNETGSVLMWSTYMGGSGPDRGWDMVLDEGGRPVVVGESYSNNFPTTPDAYDPDYNGSSEGFVTKLNAHGTDLVWSTYLGGFYNERTMWLVLTPDQEPIVCGNTGSSDFPTTPGSADETHNGLDDCYVAKFDSSGSTLIYSTYLGGSGREFGHVVALDPSGGVVVTGDTSSEDFPVTPGAYDTSYTGGDTDIFVTRLNAGGTDLVWSTFIGGSLEEEAFAMVLDHQNRPVISGEVHSNNFPVTDNAYDESYNGTKDAFLTRFDSSGSTLVWSSFLGGSGLDGGWELFVHPSGEPLLTGPTWSPDFPTTEGAYDETHGGAVDAFLVRFNIEGSSAVEGDDLHSPLRLWTGPNPFSGAVQVRLDLPQPGEVKLIALDATGRRIATVLHGFRAGGTHSIRWDGRDARGRPVVSGTYWLRLVTDRMLAQQKVVIVR